MKKNKKGFTLVELLAVIVILSILTLIITPITSNFIKDSRRESRNISVKNYISAVDKYLISSELNDITVEDGSYDIMNNGNICLGILNSDVCSGDILKINLDGQIPNGGVIVVKNSKVENYYNIQFDNFYANPSGITEDKIEISTY